jgi:hypothetical protein
MEESVLGPGKDPIYNIMFLLVSQTNFCHTGVVLLRRKKLRLGAMRQCAQVHTAGKC